MSGSSASPIVSRSTSFSCKRVRERDALVVLEVAHRVGVERARGGGRAEQAAAEARALLVGPVDQLQRDRGRLALVRRAGPRARRSTPRQPSSQPPCGTASMCEPTTTILSRLALRSSPTGSRRRRARPSRRSRPSLPSSHSRAPRQSSLHASRRAPSGPPGQLRQLVQVLERTLPVEVRHARHDRRNSGARAGFLARMIRWGRIIGVSAAAFCLLVAGSQARAPQLAYGQGGASSSCDTRRARGGLRGPGRGVYRKAPKMQMRFTLQASHAGRAGVAQGRRAPASARGSPRRAASASTRTTRPSRTCSRPASYRAVVDFRWRDARGKTIRTERAISPVCKQPDARPDLVVRNVRVEDGAYVGVVFNRGREAAGPFAVDFLVDGAPVGTVEVDRAGAAGAGHGDVAAGAAALRGRDAARGGRRRARAGRRGRRGEQRLQRRLLSLVRPPTLERAMKTEIHPEYARPTCAAPAGTSS